MTLFHQMLRENPNPTPYKDLIGKITTGIEERTYWYFTSEETDYLTKVYDRQLDN